MGGQASGEGRGRQRGGLFAEAFNSPPWRPTSCWIEGSKDELVLSISEHFSILGKSRIICKGAHNLNLKSKAEA